MRVVPGVSPTLTRGRGVVGSHAKEDTGRFYCDHPMVDDAVGETYVLSTMWVFRPSSP